MENLLLKEKIPHGTEEFPIGIHFTNQPAGLEDILYYHWHNEIEFCMITEGEAIFRVDDTEARVGVGEAIFVNSNHLHAARSLHRGTCSFAAIVFSRKLIADMAMDSINEKYIQPVIDEKLLFPMVFSQVIEWQKKALNLMHEIIEISKTGVMGCELLIKSKIIELWYLCITNAVQNERKDPISYYKKERLKSSLTYIHKNYDQKLTLQELADHLKMSESQFCRFFKETMHITPFSYIKKYRIQCSCTLLKETDKLVAEIAGIVGFENISYFNKTFHEIMKCTPKQYRGLHSN
ncbi:MAG: transcriptional regulator, AraC family [Herbinix sp.]|jgi:AraC-like DNA-binding protein|nr:transcriptional regulator, AraC family [Herbinix sp.]